VSDDQQPATDYPPDARPAEAPYQANNDWQHVRLLRIMHLVVGILLAFFACFPLLHVAMGVFIIVNPDEAFGHASGAAPPPPFFGWMFVAIGSLLILGGWTVAGLILFASRSLAQRRRWMFCLVVAGLECFFMPFGTVLGVFTFVVLLRPSVQKMFGEQPQAPPV